VQGCGDNQRSAQARARNSDWREVQRRGNRTSADHERRRNSREARHVRQEEEKRRSSRRKKEEQRGCDIADYETRRRAREARHARQEEECRRGFRREKEAHGRSGKHEGGSYRSMAEFPPLPSARSGNGRWGAAPAPRARA
jgi:hypothetical protein